MHAPLLSLSLLGSLLPGAMPLWSTLGRDAYRSSAETTLLALPATVHVSVLDAPASYSFAPVVGSAYVVGVGNGGCNMTFFERGRKSGAPAATWSSCSSPRSESPLSVGPVLTESGALVVAVSNTPRARAWGVSASSPSTVASTAWGPVELCGDAGACNITGEPLVVGDTAVFVAASGLVTLLSTLEGEGESPVVSMVDASSHLCSAEDVFAGPAAAYVPCCGGGEVGFIIVSRDGCIVTFVLDSPSNATVSSSLPSPPGGSPVIAPPSVDAATGRAFYLRSGGGVCCVTTNATAGLVSCPDWPAQCVGFSGAVAPLSRGLALSPPTLDFHGGQAYTSDAAGVVFVVRLDNGKVGSSLAMRGGAFTAPDAVVAAPVLVPGAWGSTRSGNVLLVCSTGRAGVNTSVPNATDGVGACGDGSSDVSSPPGAACLLALNVGNNKDAPHDDDADDYDDDYGATLGYFWAVAVVESSVAAPAGTPPLHSAGRALQAPAPPPTLAPPPLVTAPGFAVTPEGYVLMPSSSGIFVVFQADVAPPGADSVVMEGIIIGTVVTAVLSLCCAILIVSRRRRKREAAAAAERAAAAAELAASESGALLSADDGGGSESYYEAMVPSEAISNALLPMEKDVTPIVTPRRSYAINTLAS